MDNTVHNVVEKKLKKESKSQLNIVYETVAIISIISIVLYLLNVGDSLNFYVYLVATIIIASYFGVYAGVLAMVLTITARLIIGYFNGEDLLIIFWNIQFLFQLLTLVILTYVCGSITTTIKENAHYLVLENQQLELENTSLKTTVNQLETTRKTIKNKILTYDDNKVFMHKILDELLIQNQDLESKAIELLVQITSSENITLYKQESDLTYQKVVDYQTTDQSKLQLANDIYNKLLQKQKPVIVDDKTNETALVYIPIINQDSIKQLIVLDHLNIAGLNKESYDILLYFIQVYTLVYQRREC